MAFHLSLVGVSSRINTNIGVIANSYQTGFSLQSK